MITIIVFSKNRPCQTELCIRSIKEKFKVDKKIYLQYTYSDNEFKAGFDKLQEIHPDVEYIKEWNFMQTFRDLLKMVTTEYVLFLTDDDVFVKDVDDRITLEYNYVCFDNEMYELHCMSLRMNPSINRCYPANNKEINPPELSYNDSHMIWNWTEAEDQHCCWGYPMAINGHIYRSKDIIQVINNGRFNNVNSLEAWCNRNRWLDKPYMLSFTETKVFNVQNNFVQGPRQNEQKYSVQWLNEQFLDSKRISTDNIYGLEPKAAHGTLDYKMETI